MYVVNHLRVPGQKELDPRVWLPSDARASSQQFLSSLLISGSIINSASSVSSYTVLSSTYMVFCVFNYILGNKILFISHHSNV